MLKMKDLQTFQKEAYVKHFCQSLEDSSNFYCCRYGNISVQSFV